MECLRCCVLGILCVLGGSQTGYGENERLQSDTCILGSLYTGKLQKNQPSPVVRKESDFKIKATHRQRVGHRSVTLHEVGEPLIKKKPSVTIKPTAQERDWALTNEPEKIAPLKLIMVSATVYGEGEDCYSKIIIHDGIGKITCWSKANAFYLAGCDHWKANDRPYFMLATVMKAKNTADAAKDGCPVNRLRRAGNKFVVTESNQENKNISREVVRDIHKLYRMEKNRLRDAYHKRKQNAALRASLPKAEPEPPKPVTIYFWERDLSKEKKERGVKQ